MSRKVRRKSIQGNNIVINDSGSTFESRTHTQIQTNRKGRVFKADWDKICKIPKVIILMTVS